MGSVRDRIERPMREAPETVMETGTRRVSLGASGPTMSTRQRVQLAADQSEIVEASPHTRTGGTGYAHGAVTRTRDRMQAEAASQPEPPRPKAEVEQAADFYYDLHLQREVKVKADEQARVVARQKREADEKAAKERKVRQAQIAFLENAVMHEASDLSPAESQLFWERVTAIGAGLDPASASIAAEAIRAERK